MITTLCGPNSFLLGKSLGKIQDAFIKEHGELSVEKFDGEEASFGQIAGAIESVSFLSPKKLIIIRGLSANKQAAEQIEKLLNAANDTVDIVFVEAKPDKRGIYYKTLKKHTDMQEFAEQDERGLANWLVGEAKNRRVKLSSSDAFYLVARVGANQQLVENELTKLIEYNPVVTRDTINLLTEPTPQGSIFNLLDAAFAGDSKQALKMYAAQRAQKVEPQAILAMIVWQMHAVALVHAAGSKVTGEIAQDTKMSPFVLGKSKVIAAKLTKKEILGLLDGLCDLDRKLKSQSMDADEALKNLLIALGQIHASSY